RRPEAADPGGRGLSGRGRLRGARWRNRAAAVRDRLPSGCSGRASAPAGRRLALAEPWLGVYAPRPRGKLVRSGGPTAPGAGGVTEPVSNPHVSVRELLGGELSDLGLRVLCGAARLDNKISN